jgi:hypothetical protein
MRSFGFVALCLGFSLTASAAEPAKVSVYPATPVNSMPVTETVLQGTTVTVPQSTADCNTCPPHRTRLVDRFLPVTPTVAAPEIKACEPCENPSRISTMFRGTVLSSGCGSDVCASPGRPALFGKGFLACPTANCKSPCVDKPVCPNESCTTCSRGIARSLDYGSGHCWERFKNWICYRPCDGPRIALCRPEPYMPATMTVFPASCPIYGTCHASACTGMNRFGRGMGHGLGFGSRFGSGTCADGASCGSGTGLGLGLGARLAGHFHGKGAPDCNGAEPMLSGEPLTAGYRFATVIPKNYNRQMTYVDPIAGTVKGPQSPEAKTTVSANPTVTANTIVLAKMEQPGATPAMAKPTTVKPATAKPASPSPVVAPAAKPVMATPKWNSKAPSESRSLSTPFSHQ